MRIVEGDISKMNFWSELSKEERESDFWEKLSSEEKKERPIDGWGNFMDTKWGLMKDAKP